MKIKECRACKRTDLPVVFSLGEMCYAGVFPAADGPDPPVGELTIVECQECQLAQLHEDYDVTEFYGPTYGYRSGLNSSMVDHLEWVVAKSMGAGETLVPGDAVLDIGSSDGTLLNAYPEWLDRTGVDPQAGRFQAFYHADIDVIPEFLGENTLTGRQYKRITAIAMMYDLPDPKFFLETVKELLHPDGLFIFEVPTLPQIFENTNYDTICHEHLEYYSSTSIHKLLRKVGLFPTMQMFTKTNGGSMVFVTKPSALDYGIEKEITPWKAFREEAALSRAELRSYLRKNPMPALGASTKGNVILQYCGLTKDEVPYIYDVNPAKFHCETPGTRIPIKAEPTWLKGLEDRLLVLPWHFADNFRERYAEFLNDGGELVFPLPKLRIMTKTGWREP